MDLFTHSIDVILQNQHPGGAYVASPNFPTYHYCWLRDGSFIAFAMDRAGEHESADRFYRWVGTTIDRYSAKVDILAAQLASGKKPDHMGILNTRFTLEGFEEEGDNQWGNFQIDGYGSWLWGLVQHVKLTGNYQILYDLSASINTTLRYIELVWKQPNYDCWEEHPEFLHPYSLAPLYGGLIGIADLQDSGKYKNAPFETRALANEIKGFLSTSGVVNGRFCKHIKPGKGNKPFLPVLESGVDASLLGLVVPYSVFDISDDRINNTVQTIEKDLHLKNGGVYRYLEDVYYGGGEWIILAAWLGWAYVLAGKNDLASSLLQWIEAQADANGNLTEQVSKHLLAPQHFETWLEKWGPIANPLLWSHAMYILLTTAIEKAR